MDTESRWEAEAAGDTDGAGLGDPNGGEVGDRADLRGGFSEVQLWISSEEKCDTGTGSDPRGGQPGTQLCRGRGHWMALFCFAAHYPLAVPAGRATGNTPEGVDRRSAFRNGSASAARHRALSDASRIIKIIVKPCAGKPHAQFERELHGNRPALSCYCAIIYQ
jgi:hypothetical protein